MVLVQQEQESKHKENVDERLGKKENKNMKNHCAAGSRKRCVKVGASPNPKCSFASKPQPKVFVPKSQKHTEPLPNPRIHLNKTWYHLEVPFETAGEGI